MQPQTDGVRGLLCSRDKDIRFSPEMHTATAISCSKLTFMCWPKSYNTPGWDWLAGRAGNPSQWGRERGDILYNPYNLNKNSCYKRRRNKTLRLVPRLPRQHPASYFSYLSDTSLGANYLLQFPAFLPSKSITLWAKNVTWYCRCQSPCLVVTNLTVPPCTPALPQYLKLISSSAPPIF